MNCVPGTWTLVSKLLWACKLSYENVLCVLKNKSKKNPLSWCKSWWVHNIRSGRNSVPLNLWAGWCLGLATNKKPVSKNFQAFKFFSISQERENKALGYFLFFFFPTKCYGERLRRASSVLDAVFNVGSAELGFEAGPPASPQCMTIRLWVSLDWFPLSFLLLFKSLIPDLKKTNQPNKKPHKFSTSWHYMSWKLGLLRKHTTTASSSRSPHSSPCYLLRSQKSGCQAGGCTELT